MKERRSGSKRGKESGAKGRETDGTREVGKSGVKKLVKRQNELRGKGWIRQRWKMYVQKWGENGRERTGRIEREIEGEVGRQLDTSAMFFFRACVRAARCLFVCARVSACVLGLCA